MDSKCEWSLNSNGFNSAHVQMYLYFRSGTPLTLRRRLAVPEVRYRWSRGFRKCTNADGSAGRYSKVTLARVEIEFAKEFERLPEEMLFRSASPSALRCSKLRLTQPFNHNWRTSLLFSICFLSDIT